jgi:hypothetical protein
MKPPIVIDYRGDVVVFATPDDAEKHVEAVDLSNGDAIAYDSEGRLLEGVLVKRGLLQPVVRLKGAEDEPNHGDILRDRLVSFLLATGEEAVRPDEALANLINRVIERTKPPQ